MILPSILQSVARLRGAGDIIVFVPPVKYLLSESYDILNDKPYIQLFEPKNTEIYNPINEEFNLIDKFYNNYTAPIKDEIDKDKKDKGRPTIQFPLLDNFILDRGQDFLVYSKLSSGKYAYPLLLHYALTGQFTNCTLTEIITHKYIVKKLNVYNDTLEDDLYGYFDSIIDLMPTTDNSYMEDVVEHLKNNLLKYKNGTAEQQRIDIYVNNIKQPINSNFVKEIKYFNVICSYALKTISSDNEYYNTNINITYRCYDFIKYRPNEPLVQAYKNLNDFVIYMIDKGHTKFNSYFPKIKYNAGNFLDDKEVKNLAEALEYISENDFYYTLSKNELISRTIKGHKATDLAKYYRSIYKRVLNLFVELDDNKEIKNSSTGNVTFYEFVELKKGVILKFE